MTDSAPRLILHTKAEAEEWGYVAITESYILPSERLLLDKMLRDLRQGGCDVIVVKISTKREFVSIYRKSDEIPPTPDRSYCHQCSAGSVQKRVGSKPNTRLP